MARELIAGRYELEELIGAGGMADVYRSHDHQLDRTVAIKLLNDRYGDDARYVERFRREARAVAQLNHPNIVTVLDRGEDDGHQFIVFELIEGENLKALIRRRGRLPVETALEAAVQIGRALAFAHENGVVHRDVKPQNVIFADGGRAKVTDFGIATAGEDDGITLTGTVLGTCDYISPEQAGGLQADARSDVYSLGVLLYELLSGEVPFADPNPVTVAIRHAEEEPPSLAERRSDVPMRVEAAVARAMEKDPLERFQTMDEFVAELEGCLAALEGREEGEPTAVMRPSRRPRLTRANRRRRRRSLPRAAVVVLLAALIAGAAVAALAFRHGGGGLSSFPPASAASLHVKAIAAYDPQGDGAEHDERVPLATDGELTTYWETEHYSSPSFGNLKPGVGLVLDVGRAVRLGQLQLATDTPGFTAEIEAGDNSSGSFLPVSDSQTVDRSATFSLDVPSPRRYYVIWITELPPGNEAHVNEVRVAE